LTKRITRSILNIRNGGESNEKKYICKTSREKIKNKNISTIPSTKMIVIPHKADEKRKEILF